MDREQLLNRMIRSAERTVAELEQLVRDIEYWNAVRTDCPPFDVGRDKVALKAARDYLAHLKTRPDVISQEVFDRLQNCFRARPNG
jgi:hypothetical protein